VDWVRFRIGRSHLGFIAARLSEVFGPVERRPGTAARFRMPAARRWACGAFVAFDDDPDGREFVVVEVPGGAVAALPEDEQGRLLFDLTARGGVCTRIDLAVDWHQPAEDRIGQVHAACEAGMLTGARRYKYEYERRPAGGLLSEQVRMGARGGDGSGRFVRVYDKGLESGEATAGEWVRWELEATGTVAAEVALLILGTDWSGWQERARAIALGSVDFRERTGRRELALRPRASWWDAILGGLACVRVQAGPRVRSSLGLLSWLRTAVAPTIATLAADIGCPVEELFRVVVGRWEASEVVRSRVAVWELVHHYGPGGELRPGRLDRPG
jgi:hypothetical protein